MPYLVSKAFLNQTPIYTALLRIRNVSETPVRESLVYQTLALHAMIIVSYSFATEFAPFPRITDPNQPDYGKLDATKYLGAT